MYGTQIIEFEISRKMRLKNTYISVNKDGVLIKTNKRVSIKEIKKMVTKKSAWISQKLILYKAKSSNHEIITGSRLYYMGRSYYIQMMVNNTDTITINFTHSKFYISTPIQYLEIELQNAIENFYKQKAIQKILPMVEKWSKLMEVTPNKVSFRYAKKRWGSCSGVNRISFNYHLVKLSSSLIEYVVVHELAHIKHHNHSKDFWNFVQKHLGDYRAREEKIRAFEKLI